MEKLDVVNSIVASLEQGRALELVIVVETRGSAPRGRGAWMLVYADGGIDGTVGGGKIELFATREGAELLQAQQSRVVYYTIGGDNSDTGMICGGAVRLCYLYVDAGKLELFKHVRSTLEARAEGAFCVDFDLFAQAAGSPERLISRAHGEGSAITISQTPVMRLLPEDEAGPCDLQQRYVEILCPEGKTYIFGAGHVGAATARVLSRAGFYVVVADNREGLLTEDRLPGIERHLIDYERISDYFHIGRRDLVVITTQGHLFDTTCVIQCMAARPVYLGCIGSKRKTAYVHEQLRAAGYTDEDIAYLHLPIGLPIDAEDPEEIAISIAAEMIAVRRAKLIPRERNKGAK